MMMQKQSILVSENNINGSQNRLSSCPMKKSDSSKELSHSKITSELDIWTSILNQKNKDEASQLKTPPYIHPLVKKSKNYLSEKSLEMCTESLGSETGSDGFSSFYTSSEYNNGYTLKKKTKKQRCFPPPLPSLTSQSQHGQSQPLEMRSYNDNGRLFLFLQVVSVPSHKNFFAKRQNGRLILTFANEEEEEEKEEIADEFEEDANVIEKTKMMSNLELVVNKEIGLVNKSPKWSEKFNKGTKFEDVKIVQHGSLPMINAYEYYWQNKVVVSGNMNIHQGSNEASQDSHQLLVLRGKNGDYLVHNLKCHRDSKTRRSFMFWDPCCIAT